MNMETQNPKIVELMGLAIDAYQRANSIEATDAWELLEKIDMLYKTLSNLVDQDRQISMVQAIAVATDKQATETLAAKMQITTQAYYMILGYLNDATKIIHSRFN